MANKIVLISNDSDFFEYIKPKLELRKSDELYSFSFEDIPEKLHLLKTAVIIINSENEEEKTLDLIKLFNETPIIIFSFNDNDVFKRKCYRAGVLDFIPLLTPDADFRTRILPALKMSSLLLKKEQYRELLVNNNIIDKIKEVYIDYNQILEKELELINNNKKNATFLAISPGEKSKFLIRQEVLEVVLINNIRKNDILMTYAPNKYFLLLFDTNLTFAEKFWQKIKNQFPVEVFAGIIQVSNQKKQQLINEALNKLHSSINNNHFQTEEDIKTSNNIQTNFKLFKQEFEKKIDNIIAPVFYQIQQKYNDKIMNVKIEQSSGNGFGEFRIINKQFDSCFIVTSAGFSKINIDISVKKDNKIIDTKRISLDPEEFEQALLGDLLEQFIIEYKRRNDD